MSPDQVPRNPRSKFSDSGDRKFVPVYVRSVLTLSTKIAFVSLPVCATQLEKCFFSMFYDTVFPCLSDSSEAGQATAAY